MLSLMKIAVIVRETVREFNQTHGDDCTDATMCCLWSDDFQIKLAVAISTKIYDASRG